ncbi:MAG: bifunctional metallophosphatase/5'-nucleotidase [bacterium]|nr:bifunctional metallophosphatase/5'-nucleotidase [bacterium]
MKKIIPFIGILFVLPMILFLLTACPNSTGSTGSENTGSESTATGENGALPVNLFKLTILHTNDTHARILQVNSSGGTCNDEDAAAGECFGGVARRATMINQIRVEKGNVLLLDAGDQFQGTLFYTQYKGMEAQTFMNMLGYDAMTLGNHEFDDGTVTLTDFVSGLEFPVVSSNIDFSGEPALDALIDPYKILEIGGRKIGIIGFTTEDVPSVSKPGPNVAFNSIDESAATVVGELESQGVNIIIALSHSGLARDLALAASADGIDVIVGGHTHTYMSNTDPEAEAAYPVEVESPSGNPVLVMQAASHGIYLGDLDVTFNDQGVATEWSGEPIKLDSLIPEDPTVMAKVDEMNQLVAPLSVDVVGKTLVDLEGREEITRHYECNTGDLICDALLWETTNAGTQIAVFNGGGIRSGIQAGDITYANVLEVLPFGDTLAYFQLKGSDVRDLLEYGVSRAEDPQNEGTGRFLQTSGMRYTWDPSKDVGSRITDIEVADPEGNFAPLDDNAIYKIVTLLYIREGGDGYTILQERAIEPYDFGRVIADILVDYLHEFSPISPTTDGRISRVE